MFFVVWKHTVLYHIVFAAPNGWDTHIVWWVLLSLWHPIISKYLRFRIDFGLPKRMPIKHLSPQDQTCYASFPGAPWDYLPRWRVKHGSHYSWGKWRYYIPYFLHGAFGVLNTSMRRVLRTSRAQFWLFFVGQRREVLEETVVFSGTIVHLLILTKTSEIEYGDVCGLCCLKNTVAHTLIPNIILPAEWWDCSNLFWNDGHYFNRKYIFQSFISGGRLLRFGGVPFFSRVNSTGNLL